MNRYGDLPLIMYSLSKNMNNEKTLPTVIHRSIKNHLLIILDNFVIIITTPNAISQQKTSQNGG